MPRATIASLWRDWGRCGVRRLPARAQAECFGKARGIGFIRFDARFSVAMMLRNSKAVGPVRALARTKLPAAFLLPQPCRESLGSTTFCVLLERYDGK
jgi:hypothetical protein